MLTFAEEVLVLILDEERGELAPGLPSRSLALVLSGAVLMDLSLENRIDTDPERLMLVDSTPLGDDILDPTLAEIAGDGRVRDTGYWLERMARRRDQIQSAAQTRLTERGILQSEDDGLLSLTPSVSRSRRYALADGQSVEEVGLRIMRILFSDDVPDPRDVAMIALASACGVFRTMLSSAEREQVRDRIELLEKLDLIGRTMALAIRELDLPDEPLAEPPRPKEIPIAPGLPLLGSSLAMMKGVLAFVVRQYRDLGPIFRIRTPGRQLVCIAGPEAVRFLTSHGTRVFRSREPMANFHDQMDASSSIVTMDGVDHVTTRRVQAQGYSTKVAAEGCLQIVDIARREIGRWPVGKPVDVLPAVRSIVAEQMGRLMTGFSPRGYTKDLALLVRGLLLSSTVSPLIMKLPRFRRARARAIDMAEKVLAHKRRNGPQPTGPDFLDHMLGLRESDPQLVPETNLNLIALAPYLAGLDSSSNTFSFMLYNVLKRPDLMERMTAEADALFEDGLMRGEGLRRLDVTRRAVMETMRLHPTAPAVLRTASNSFEFAGHTVAAGSRVMVATGVGHMLEEYFPDPSRFDIDRYTRARAEHRRRDAYAPFGAGHHKCLGSGFAPVQFCLTAATILRELELQPLDARDVLRVKSVPTTHPVGFRIRVLGRRSDDGPASLTGRTRRRASRSPRPPPRTTGDGPTRPARAGEDQTPP